MFRRRFPTKRKVIDVKTPETKKVETDVKVVEVPVVETVAEIETVEEPVVENVEPAVIEEKPEPIVAQVSKKKSKRIAINEES